MLQGGVFASFRSLLVILLEWIDTIQTMSEPGVNSVMVSWNVVAPSANLADDYLQLQSSSFDCGLASRERIVSRALVKSWSNLAIPEPSMELANP